MVSDNRGHVYLRDIPGFGPCFNQIMEEDAAGMAVEEGPEPPHQREVKLAAQTFWPEIVANLIESVLVCKGLTQQKGRSPETD